MKQSSRLGTPTTNPHGGGLRGSTTTSSSSTSSSAAAAAAGFGPIHGPLNIKQEAGNNHDLLMSQTQLGNLGSSPPFVDSTSFSNSNNELFMQQEMQELQNGKQQTLSL